MLHVSRPALASVIAIIIAIAESSILICNLFNYADIGGSPCFAFLFDWACSRQSASLRIASMAPARVVREIGHRQAVAQSWSQVC